MFNKLAMILLFVPLAWASGYLYRDSHGPASAPVPSALVAVTLCGKVIALAVVASDGSAHDLPKVNAEQLAQLHRAVKPEQKLEYAMPCTVTT